MDTRAVVEHHLEALKAGDVEATMSDYTEDSVVVAGGAVTSGLDALRSMFAGAFETMFKPGASKFTLDTLDVEGEYALITWKLSFEGGEISFGTDTFHVRDGKIMGQTAVVQMA
jgi:uncharacterized protein (TIGR02246 family)